MEKGKALHRYVKSQEALDAAIVSIPEAQKSSLLVEGTWTIKELLSHLIGWDQALLDPLRAFLSSGIFPVNVIQDHDAYNALQVTNRLNKTLEQVIRELSQTRRELLNQVAELDSEQCQVIFPAPWGGESTIPDMLAGLAWHNDEHLKDFYAAILKS